MYKKLYKEPFISLTKTFSDDVIVMSTPYSEGYDNNVGGELDLEGLS